MVVIQRNTFVDLFHVSYTNCLLCKLKNTNLDFDAIQQKLKHVDSYSRRKPQTNHRDIKDNTHINVAPFLITFASSDPLI